MTYRMLVADLDGTLRAESNPTFTPRVREAVARAQKQGTHVVMATGRMFRTAEPYIRDLGLVEPVICDHGASIFDLQAGKILFEKRVSLDLVREVAAFADSTLTLTACADGELYTNQIERDAPGDPYTREHIHLISDFRSLAQEPQKLLFLNDETTTDRIFPELLARFGDCMQVVRASTRRVELTHHETSKGAAAALLAAKWNIPPEQAIAMGDQDTDRSMIEWAGLGVAMGNAVESVKAIADFVAPSVDEDGAAVVIERFILNM